MNQRKNSCWFMQLNVKCFDTLTKSGITEKRKNAEKKQQQQQQRTNKQKTKQKNCPEQFGNSFSR